MGPEPGGRGETAEPRVGEGRQCREAAIRVRHCRYEDAGFEVADRRQREIGMEEEIVAGSASGKHCPFRQQRRDRLAAGNAKTQMRIRAGRRTSRDTVIEDGDRHFTRPRPAAAATGRRR